MISPFIKNSKNIKYCSPRLLAQITFTILDYRVVPSTKKIMFFNINVSSFIKVICARSLNTKKQARLGITVYLNLYVRKLKKYFSFVHTDCLF